VAEGGGLLNRYRGLKPLSRVRIPPSPPELFPSMTAAQFRRLALSLPQAEERSHMSHPDFRIAGGKIFATLGSPDKAWGMVKLAPEQQHEFMQAEPEVFKPAPGAWGRAARLSCT
jgi:YjbR